MAIVGTNPRCPSSQKSTFFIFQNYVSSHFNIEISHLNFAKRKPLNKSEIIKTHSQSLFHPEKIKMKKWGNIINQHSKSVLQDQQTLAQFYNAVNIKLQEYIQDTPKV